MKKIINIFVVCCLVLVALPCTVFSESGYPDDAVYFNNHAYKAFDKMTWNEARLHCESLCGHLVTITSAEEQEFIESLALNKGVNYWLGGRGGEDWQWITDENWQYTNWGSGQPDNKQINTGIEENYLQLCVDWKYKWNDSANEQDKTAGIGYICEWDEKLTNGVSDDIHFFNNHTYKVFDSLAWDEAKNYCEFLGGYLATITSAEEQEFIESLTLNKGANYWLGGEKGEDWQWITGENWQYTNWGSGQPDNKQKNTGIEEDYLQLCVDWKYKWNDSAIKQDKTAQIGFICEWSDTPAQNENLGFNASDWALTELKEADKLGLIPDSLKDIDLTQPITRKEFAAVSVRVYESLTGKTIQTALYNPFTDCSDTEVLKAYNIGITVGTSATTFSPNDLLDREQAATMLTRVYKKFAIKNWTLDTDINFSPQFKLLFTAPSLFADDANISDWARDSVYFMAAKGIISGIGDNNFAPRAVTSFEEATGYAQATREQALLIAVRMVKELG